MSGVLRAYHVERRKLAAQLATRVLFLVCAVGPFGFAGLLRAQSGSPADTLYGGWVHGSGFAVSLVVLGFAGSWGFPLIAGVVAGDVFSSEDRYGTWKTVLTRSTGRGELFAGKLLAASTTSIALAALVAASSLLAGLLLVGHQPLLSLSSTQLSAGGSLARVFLAWLLCIPPVLAFTAIGALASVATRNGIAGVLAAPVAALAMQLLLLVGAGVWAHELLIASAFNAWPALFVVPRFYGGIAVAVVVSTAWIAACTGGAWLALRRRDFAGGPVARRAGWRPALRVLAVGAGVVVLLALASGWGPPGVTAARVRRSFVPAFNRLVVLQQRRLGHPLVPGTPIEVAPPSCSRRGAAPRGPGEWVCTLSVAITTGGGLPPEPTTIAYDLTVQSDGCYKAQSPPLLVGRERLMRDARGRRVINPLYTIYGCFDVL